MLIDLLFINKSYILNLIFQTERIMKKLLLIAFLWGAFMSNIWAQAPQAVCYQALAKDNQNNNILETIIGIRATIVKGGANGNAEWIEEHTPQTDQFGLFTIEIGQGTFVPGGAQSAFENIDWGNGEYWLRIEFDPFNAGNYQLMGANKIISVPYALYAEGANKAANADMANEANHAQTADTAMVALNVINDADGDPANELQTLSFENGELSILAPDGSPIGAPVGLSSSMGGTLDDSNTNEIQNLVSQNGQLFLEDPNGNTNGNGVTFDESNTNEIQNIIGQGGQLFLEDINGNTNGSGVTFDESITNEIQSLVSENGELVLQNPDGTTSGDGIVFDDSNTNEIQTLSLDGNMISISGGNTVELATHMVPFSAPGASFDLPQGIYGEHIVRGTGNYTVPNGKTFWVTAGPPNVKLKGLGITPYAIHPTTPNMPVLRSGQVVQDCMCTGILIENTSLIEPMVINLITEGSYTVPQGKVLFIKSGIKNDEIGYLKVNNEPMEFLRSNFTRGTRIITFAAGTLIEPIPSNSDELILTGFLIDEEF